MVTPAQSRMIDASLAPAALGAQIDAAIVGKAFDAQKTEGAEVVQLLESAANVGDQGGDPLVAKATGVGGLLDVRG